MSNNELRGKVVESINWALGFISDCDEGVEAIDSESVARVLDSTSKILNQVNEMDRLQLEANEKEASRLQQLDIEKEKLELDRQRLEQEKAANKQKMKAEFHRTCVEIAKTVAMAAGSAITYYAFSSIFKMHKHDDFLTGTEKDALNQASKIIQSIKY